VVKSWVSQVIRQDQQAFQIACDKWEEQDSRRATRTDILEIFRSIVRHIAHCTFIVDGLDECIWAEEGLKTRDCDSVMDFFAAIQQATTHTETRIIVFSRDEPHIRHGYNHVLTNSKSLSSVELKISPKDVHLDATIFSRSIINKKLANKDEELKDELSQRMVDRCDGMFLWMKMLEDNLRGGMNRRKLEETINQAPTAIEHLYDRNWNRISNLSRNDKNRAFSILRWAAFALRPLTIIEITEALLIADSDDYEDLLVDELPDNIDEEYVKSEILGLCGLLIESRQT
jgi:hypothetical protein